ncbi:Phosphatidylglycerophosphatase and protein-tyrosine phosphatase 1, partial [Perkinsus olseni]
CPRLVVCPETENQVLPPGISPEVRSSLVAKCYQLVNSAYLSPKIVTERRELVAVACTLLSLRLHGVLPVQQSDVVGGVYSTWYEPFLAKPCRAEEVEEVAREVVLAYTLNEKTLEVTSATVTSPPPSPASMSQPSGLYVSTAMLTSPQWQRTLTAAGRHRVSPSRTPKRWFFSRSRPNRATTSAWVDGFFSNGMESIANSSPLWVMEIVSEVLFWPTFAWNYVRRLD